MEVNIKEISPVKKAIHITVPQQFVDEKFQAAYEKIGKTAKIKGFRPGKAPKHILKQTYKGTIMQELFQQIINETYYKVLSENDIWPVSHPEIQPKELVEGKDFEYVALVETKPDFENLKYTELTLTKEKLIISDEVIQKEIDILREQNSTSTLIEDSEKLIENGNIAVIDFEGSFEDGTPIPKGNAENHSIEVGLKQFIPGFEEGLVGMKVGEEKTLNLKFPDNYTNAELNGKKVNFNVKLKEIREKQLPELNDDFAKSAGKYESLDDLKTKTREGLVRYKEGNINFNLRQNIAQELIKLNDFEAPKSIIQEQKKRLISEASMRLTHLGPDNVKKYVDENDAEFLKQATTNVKLYFLFEEIAKIENIKIEDSDINSEVEFCSLSISISFCITSSEIINFSFVRVNSVYFKFSKSGFVSTRATYSKSFPSTNSFG